MSETKPFGADRCPNCGEYGAHYCGPCLGEPGFFICKKKPRETGGESRTDKTQAAKPEGTNGEAE